MIFKYGSKDFFKNMCNLKLEPADCPCQRNRIFVKFSWDGFVYLRNCFYPLVCHTEALNTTCTVITVRWES